MSLETAERPRVLIIEDSDPVRTNLQESLERRGIEALGARDVATARKLINESSTPFDVAVLDMRLEDPGAPGVSGVDLGLEIRAIHTSTEFLIVSAYPDVNFSDEALRLGVAAYLKKPQPIDEIIRHIRALCFRGRAARLPRECDTQALHQLVRSSKTREDAMMLFCQRVLGPMAEAVLGSRVLLLFSDRQGTYSCGGTLHAAGASSDGLFHELVSRAFLQIGFTKPFMVDRHSAKPRDEMEEALLRGIDGMSLVTLVATRDFRLSLGLCAVHGSFSEAAELLAPVVADYARSTVMGPLLGIAERWRERDDKRPSLVSAATRFCALAGREQLDASVEAEGENGEPPLKEVLSLHGEEMAAAGQLLAAVGSQAEQTTTSTEAYVVSLASLADEAWKRLRQRRDVPKDLLDSTGDCLVAVDQEETVSVLSRLLLWFVLRNRHDGDSLKSIRATFESSDGIARAIIEDTSQRLAPAVRRALFAPFSEQIAVESLSEEHLYPPGGTLSLLLAKAQLHFKLGGNLIDRTDKLADSEVGNVLAVELPAAS